MNALMFLFFTKIKAAIRNVLGHPVSAILTIAAISFFGFIAFIMMTSDNISVTTNITSVEDMTMMLLGYTAFLMGIMLLQKRTALVRQNDAFYLFTRPFTRSQTLAYITIDTIKGSSIYAFISVFYTILLMNDSGADLPLFMYLCAATIVLYFTIFALLTYIYLLEITSSHVRKIKAAILIGLAAGVLLLYGKNFIEANYDAMMAFDYFLHDPAFYLIPMFGWLKWGVVSLALDQYFAATAAAGLMLAAAVILSVMILTIKGDFYEKAMEDAAWYADLRKGMKEGKQANANLKIKTVDKVRFQDGARAILSKNILEMRKTKSWLRQQDVFLMLFYLLLAKLMGMDFMFFQYYILIVLAMSVNTDFVMSELKKHYIYLIPEKPLHKLINLLLPVILRLVMLIVIALLPAWIVYQVDVLTFAAAVLNLLGYALLFVGANVWSLRLMKSRNNVLVEQMIKVLVLLIAIIPAIIVTVLIFLIVPFDPLQIISIAAVASLVVNIIMGLLFIVSAKSILHGANMMAE